jgi:hypothetical protein
MLSVLRWFPRWGKKILLARIPQPARAGSLRRDEISLCSCASITLPLRRKRE